MNDQLVDPEDITHLHSSLLLSEIDVVGLSEVDPCACLELSQYTAEDHEWRRQTRQNWQKIFPLLPQDHCVRGAVKLLCKDIDYSGKYLEEV